MEPLVIVSSDSFKMKNTWQNVHEIYGIQIKTFPIGNNFIIEEQWIFQMKFIFTSLHCYNIRFYVAGFFEEPFNISQKGIPILLETFKLNDTNLNTHDIDNNSTYYSNFLHDKIC